MTDDCPFATGNGSPCSASALTEESDLHLGRERTLAHVLERQYLSRLASQPRCRNTVLALESDEAGAGADRRTRLFALPWHSVHRGRDRLEQRRAVDVLFADARFQIRDIVGDRLRGKEWAEREKRCQAAQAVSDVTDAHTPSAAISLDKVAKMVAAALAGKARHYAPASIANLDALVYLDLANSHLWPLEPAPARAEVDELSRQGWRSVSLLAVPYGAVLPRPEC
jgi:hypothetical protein